MVGSAFEGGKLNPRDFEEFADANVLQRELFFWKAEKIIRKSWNIKFLNKCLRLMVEANHENWMLGQAIANEASRRLLKIAFPLYFFQKVNYGIKKLIKR